MNKPTPRSPLGVNPRAKQEENGIESLRSILQAVDDADMEEYPGPSSSSVASARSSNSEDSFDNGKSKRMEEPAAPAEQGPSIQNATSFDSNETSGLERDIQVMYERVRNETEKTAKLVTDAIINRPESFFVWHKGVLEAHIFEYDGKGVILAPPIDARDCNNDLLQEKMNASGGALFLREVNHHRIRSKEEALKRLAECEHKDRFTIICTGLRHIKPPADTGKARAPGHRSSIAFILTPDPKIDDKDQPQHGAPTGDDEDVPPMQPPNDEDKDQPATADDEDIPPTQPPNDEDKDKDQPAGDDEDVPPTQPPNDEDKDKDQPQDKASGKKGISRELKKAAKARFEVFKASAIHLGPEILKFHKKQSVRFDTDNSSFDANLCNWKDQNVVFVVPYAWEKIPCGVPLIQEALERDGAVILAGINGQKINPDNRKEAKTLLESAGNTIVITWLELDKVAQEKAAKDQSNQVVAAKNRPNQAASANSTNDSRCLLKKKKADLLNIAKVLGLKNMNNKNKSQIVAAILSARKDSGGAQNDNGDSSSGGGQADGKKDAMALVTRINARWDAAKEKGDLSYLHGMELKEIQKLPWKHIYDLLPPTNRDSTKESKLRRVKRALEELEHRALIDVSESNDFQKDLEVMVENGTSKMLLELVDRRVVEKWNIRDAHAGFRGDPRPTNGRATQNADGTFSIFTTAHCTFNVGSAENFERVIYVDGKPWLMVKKSNIEGAGFGLFAMRDFKNKETIAAYCGEAMTFKDVKTREGNIYAIEDNGVQYVPQDHKMYMGVHFANSSKCTTRGKKNLFRLSKNKENANCLPGRLFVATDNIKSGDEICWPYDFDEGNSTKRKRASISVNEDEDEDNEPRKKARKTTTKPNGGTKSRRHNPSRKCRSS